MNLVTAAQMLVLLEQTQQDGPEDDAYFIIHRMLRAELRKGNDPAVLQEAYREFGRPTDFERRLWFSGNKVDAIKKYRDRTGAGLYQSKKSLEAVEQECATTMLLSNQDISGVTSCG
jgi:hypothetical protein